MKKLRSNLSLKKKNKKRKLELVIVAVIVAILIIGGILFAINRINTKQNLEGTETSNIPKDRTSKDGLPGSNYATGNTEKSTPQKPQDNSDSSPPPQQGTAAVEISSFSQNNGMVNTQVALSNINRVGKCVFTFTKDGAKSVVKEVDSNGKTCSSSVQSTEFSKLDIWTLNIAFFKGSSKVVDTTLNVTIN